MAKKKGKTEGVQAREARLEAERALAAEKAAAIQAAAAAVQAAADESARLAEERKAAKAEKRKKTKRPRFVREAVAKPPVAPKKPKPLPERATSTRGKMMTKNVALVPKEESEMKPNLRS